MAIDREIARKIAEKFSDEKNVWENLFGIETDPNDLGPGTDFPARKNTTDPGSFIVQVTKNNIFMDSITPLSIDSPGASPTGETDRTKSQITFTTQDQDRQEQDGWYYYTFDWRNYQNTQGANPEKYDPNGNIADYFQKLAFQSIPYAVQLWGKKFGGNETQAAWYSENVQFGGYTIEARTAPPSADTLGFWGGEEQPDAEEQTKHLQNINPGLTFLIGMKMKAVDALPNDESVTFSVSDINTEACIIIRHDEIDKVFNKIADILKTYHGIREKFTTSFKIGPKSCNFEDEANLIKEFKSALKTLIKDSAETGGGMPNKSVWNVPLAGELGTGSDPEHMSSSEIEAWARHPQIWNKPENIIEIGVTKKEAGRTGWEVAYVREYAPVTSFKARETTPPGIEGIRRLGQVLDNRIIGGGFSKSQKQNFASFKNAAGVRDPRTVAFISRMHARNGKNGGLKSEYNLDPQKGTPIKDILKFIEGVTLGASPSHITWTDPQPPDAYHKATEAFLAERGGSIATPRQRSLATARTNNPSWAETYEHYSSNWVIEQTDQFFASLPEKTERLRINESPPYGLDEIWNNVLNNADVQRLTRELIRCATDPNEWLEIACRYAMKELGIDALFEEMEKDGTMDKLRKRADIGRQVSDSFNIIAAEKEMSQANFDRLAEERDKYNEQVLDLLNKRRALESELNKPNISASERDKLNKDLRATNYEIEAAMGRRQQVEMDSDLAYANKSVGAWMPMTPDGAARSAQAAQKMTSVMMDITDPDFKKQLCANIISYSLNAAQFLYDLYRSIEELISGEGEGEDIFTLDQENRPKSQTDNTGMYFVEAVRAILAQVVAATTLYFVKKILNELVEACKQLKAQLWAGLADDERKNTRTPGKAKYNDLLAETPTKAARDLTIKLSGFIDIADEEIATQLLNLMEDLELLLSQVELCSLSRGTATIEVLKIVKNLLKIRYSELYSNLQGADSSLSFAKIKDFFRNFEPLIKSEYCEELEKPDKPLQLYQECPPYVQDLCGDLLIGHATDKQIKNICRRARMERLDMLAELVDFAYNPEKSNIPDPADPTSPNAVSQDMYPANIMNDMLADQNLRPASEAFKGEMFAFTNKLLYGSATGAPNIPADKIAAAGKKHANSSDADGGDEWSGTSAEGFVDDVRNDLKKDRILGKIHNSLSSPFRWFPGYPLSSFSVGDGLWNQALRLYLVDNAQYPEIIEFAWASVGKKTDFEFVQYPMKFGKVAFLPVARFESFLNLYGTSAPTVTERDLKLHYFKESFSLTGIQSPDKDFKAPKDKPYEFYYNSPAAEQFYNKINENWPAHEEHLNLEESKKGIKFLFNILIRNMGNQLAKKFQNSVIFKTEGKEKLEEFFANFFPQSAFDADESCNLTESSLLKINSVKKYIRDRKSALEQIGWKPDLNEETSNLARAQAEGSVMVLMRIYAFETALRLLPLLSTIKCKSILTSEAVINVIIEHILYELAMLDYKKVRNTFSTQNATELRNTRPVKGNMLDPSGGVLTYDVSNSGQGRYVEEPCTPAEAGNPFRPKYQAHVIYYANNILRAKWKKEKKEGRELLDPITGEKFDIGGAGSSFGERDPLARAGVNWEPYSTLGITYLLREQLAEVSDFFEKEFSALFDDIGIQAFERFFLEAFLYKDLTENPDSFGGHLVGNEELTYNPYEPWDSEYPPEAYMPDPAYGNANIKFGGGPFGVFNLMPSISSLNENLKIKWAENVSPSSAAAKEQTYAGYIKAVFDDFGETEKAKKAYDTSITEATKKGLMNNLNSHLLMNQRFYEVGAVSSHFYSEEVENLYSELIGLVRGHYPESVSDAEAGISPSSIDTEGDIITDPTTGTRVIKYSKSTYTDSFGQEYQDYTEHDKRIREIYEKLAELGVPLPKTSSNNYHVDPSELVLPFGSEDLLGEKIQVPEELKFFTDAFDSLSSKQGEIVFALTKFAKESNFMEGGFILEPYIRVKQHTPFGDFEHQTNTDPELKKHLAEKAFKDTLKEWIENADIKQAEYIAKNCADDDTFCQETIISNWNAKAQEAAEKAYNDIINKEGALTYTPGELDKHFGDLWRGNGAYINIAQWLNSMSGRKPTNVYTGYLDPLKLNLNPDTAKRPHTDWFDQWMYGLRLVYIAPLKTQTNVPLHSNDGAITMEKDKILEGFYKFVGVENIEDDPWDIYNKKTYILHERVNLATMFQNKLYYQLLENQVSGKEYESEKTPLDERATGIASPPIFSIPLIETEVPVGSLMRGEKVYARKLIYDQAYSNAIKEGKSPSEAKNEAENVSTEFMNTVDSSVPLNYFTYQNWWTTYTEGANPIVDDYPIEQLLCSMVESKKFEDLFMKIFPIEDYKILFAMYILGQTFDLQEGNIKIIGENKPYNGDYIALFEHTKAQLRHMFYSNTLAHDSNSNIGTDPSDEYQAMLNEEEQDWWSRVGGLLLGNPPNYANIFLMTPIAILKAMVSVTDPTWGTIPWTTPGVTAHILDKLMGPWASTWLSGQIKEGMEEPKQKKAIVCPDEFAAKTSVEYSKEELEFVEMMKSYGIPENDRNYILTRPYRLPASHEDIKELYPNAEKPHHSTINGSSSGYSFYPAKRYFSDTLLFEQLLFAWKNKKDEDLQKIGIVFNNLKEYYDSYIETCNHYTNHYEDYMRHALHVYEGHYDKENDYWITETDFEEVLFVNCDIVDHPRFTPYIMPESICKHAKKFDNSLITLHALETMFSPILEQIGLSIQKTNLKLKGPQEMKMVDNTGLVKGLLRDIGTLGQGEGEGKLLEDAPTSTTPGIAEVSDQTLIDFINENQTTGVAIPSRLIPEKELAVKISNILLNLVWNNDNVMEYVPGNPAYAAGLFVLSNHARNAWQQKGNPGFLSFNHVDGHDMRNFWLEDNWKHVIEKGHHYGKWGHQLGAHPHSPNPISEKYFFGKGNSPHAALYDGLTQYDLDHLDAQKSANELWAYWANPDTGYELATYGDVVSSFHLDALTEITDPSPQRRDLGTIYVEDRASQLSTYGQPDPPPIDKTFQEALVSSSPDKINFYDMYNIDHHEKIVNYWLRKAANPFVIKSHPGPNIYKEYVNQPAPQWWWRFADLRYEAWHHNWVNTGATGKWADRGRDVLVLDHVAWYYPKLASVIAEMMYKMYNISMQTTCIDVKETNVGVDDNNETIWDVKIAVKQCPSDKSYYYESDHGHHKAQPRVMPMPMIQFKIRKQSVRNDLINRNFIL